MRRGRRGLGLAVVVGGLVWAGPAGAAPGTKTVVVGDCREGVVPEAPFVDIEGTAFEDEIDCLFMHELTWGAPAGRPANEYAPALDVRRDQMASFVARMIEHFDPWLLVGYDSGNRFTDVPSGSPHAGSINVLAAMGIVQGGAFGEAADRFEPDRRVTRAQMASLLARTLEQVFDVPLETTRDHFDDDEHAVPHEDDINRLASAGVVLGRGHGRYDPDAAVDRGAMAAFLVRSIDEAHDWIDSLEHPPWLSLMLWLDEADDRRLNRGDVLTLRFDVDEERLALSSPTLHLVDEDGDEAVVSADGPGVASIWEIRDEGYWVEVSLLEDPDVVLDGWITIDECIGVMGATSGLQATCSHAFNISRGSSDPPRL